MAVRSKAAIGDFLELGANAFVAGLVVAIALSVLTLLLTTSAQAATPDDGEPIVVSASDNSLARTVIVSGTRGNQPWSVALTPVSDSAGVGALWARWPLASLADEMTRGDGATLRPAVIRVAIEPPDTASPLHLLLGLLAIASAGIVAVIGRTVPARRDA